MARTKRTKIVATRYVSPAENIPKLRLRPGSAIDPTGELTVLPRPLGIRFAPDKKRQSGQGRRRGEGRGGEEWRYRGSDGEEMEEVDFAPLLLEFLWAPIIYLFKFLI